MSDEERARWRSFAAHLERYAEAQDTSSPIGVAVAAAMLAVAQAARQVEAGDP